MPPRKRGGTFSGSLLDVPTPLPDEDDRVGEEPSEPSSPPAAVLAPEPPPQAPEPPAPEPAAGAPDVQPEPDAAASDETAGRQPGSRRSRGSGAATSGASRERPPATIRLDDRAAPQLWDTYVEAKQADPFLSYRQFASGVVLDGLAAHRRRQQRSS